MAGHSSKKVIFLALGANFGIALAKFVAFFFTASSAMLAEAIHSLADTGNQILLLLGMRRAAQPPDARHPFGYKMESYFWSFIVAMMLFTLGGLFAIYEGLHKLHELHALIDAGEHPSMEHPMVAVGVLVLGILLEGLSWLAATREVNRLRGDQGLLEYIESSKSTEIIVIFLEDTAALIGLVLALGGVILVLVTGNPFWDVYATFAIGGLLVVIAFTVARETKSLLIGEAATQQSQDAIRALVVDTEGVLRLLNMRTMQLGDDEFLVSLKVQWQGDLTVEDVSRRTNGLEDRIRKAIPRARYLFVEPDVHDPNSTRREDV
ncbi:MAG: cation diffusion facilitator family transporter [Myxococcales bacterium]|nr:cation diffusion facilitator family transporter [Myxococcales bacterium]